MAADTDGPDLGRPIAYLALVEGVPVLDPNGNRIGVVEDVVADERTDRFHGIVLHTRPLPGRHLYADADQIAGIYESGVLLAVGADALGPPPEPPRSAYRPDQSLLVTPAESRRRPRCAAPGTGSPAAAREAALDTDRFLTLVADLARTDRDGAEGATAVVLTTLAEHLSRGEAADLLERLPPELQPYVYTTSGPEKFDVREFVRRVAEREGVPPPDAERHAGAVFIVLRQAVGDQEFADGTAQLPREYGPLLTGRSSLSPAGRIIAQVAERAETSEAEARVLTEAVLETLAQRIAPGDVDDLAALLPVELHEPLRRGARQPDPRMDVTRFAWLVADRAGLDILRAAPMIPAVFAVLRAEVGDEFLDVQVQLPEEYRPLLGAARTR